MNMLRVISSHSQNRLVRALAGQFISEPAPPLEREAIIVLSNGMARWLSMEIATLHGISAGLEYHFPNDLLDRCFRAVLPDIPQTSPFTPDAMAWRIAARLPELAPEPGFEQLASYLGDSNDDRRLMQLARAIADTFDQYTIFRPELLMAWDAGQGDDWQPRLWRAVSHGHKGMHRAALLHRFSQQVPNLKNRPNGIPRRISLIGISYLPPFHLQALSLLSAVSEVTCYLLNPCGEYWGNLISERDLSRLVLRTPSDDLAQEHYETGNPLLSSLGTLGQEFFESLLDFGFACDLADEIDTGADDTNNASILQIIQQDILTLTNRTGSTDKHPVHDNDRSILIHSCHGQLREMEVLYDQLLAMFDELTDLEPRQIVVMIPDIENYVPYIMAVFGGRSGGRPALPFAIADRSSRRESPYIEAFMALLGLAESRFGNSEIIGLLELEPVMTRFNLGASDLTAIRSWLTECGVRWGVDAEHRGELGFTPYADFTWQAGLDRMLLGYAMPPDAAGVYKSMLPCPGIEGRQALPAGRLADFLAAARRVRQTLNRRHTLSEWAIELTRLTAELLKSDDTDDRGHGAVVRALNMLTEAQTDHGYDRRINLSAVRDLLARHFDHGGSGYGFMGGGITFCAMLPMRSIPMRVVCLAGMNDGVFPRSSRPPGFSLMSGPRRRGDRSLRDEDRYLFLEALMSARERLCISYTGQSDRDNTTIPPSLLVAELADYIGKSFVTTSAKPPEIVIRHHLQGFSPAYFDGAAPDRLFSYDGQSCAALEAQRIAGQQSRRNFLTEPLPPVPDRAEIIDLRQLRRFITAPPAFFLGQRLRVSPYDPADAWDEHEPFAITGLSGYALNQELLTCVLEGGAAAAAHDRARARGFMPPLIAGEAAFDLAWARAANLGRVISPLLSEPLEPLEFELQLGSTRLVGALEQIRCDRHLVWRFAGLKGKDRLNVWLDHLVLNSLRAKGYPCESVMIASDRQVILPPIDNAASILTELLELYARGLTAPLPFFPQTSWLFLTEGADKAGQRWTGDDFTETPAESSIPANSICFGGQDVLATPAFSELAERIYAPYRAVAVEEKLS